MTTRPDIEALLNDHGWAWREHPSIADLTELYDVESGQMLAWVVKRPGYCDRGHWQTGSDVVPDLDAADAFPRYFMRKNIAMQEITEFLAWRLHRNDAQEIEEPDLKAVALALNRGVSYDAVVDRLRGTTIDPADPLPPIMVAVRKVMRACTSKLLNWDALLGAPPATCKVAGCDRPVKELVGADKCHEHTLEAFEKL